MRELSLNEIGMVSGAGPAMDTVRATAETAGYGFAAGTVVGTTFRGAAKGARFGIYGAIAGGAIGLAAGIYDVVQASKDGSDYNTK